MTWMQYGATAYELGNTFIGVTPRDIAHAAARINRYVGHTAGPHPLSIARHMLYVSRLLDLDPWAAMYGLVHDVAETVTNDLSYPFKRKLQEVCCGKCLAAIEMIEENAEIALWRVLGLPTGPMPEKYRKLVKWADWAAAAAEKRDLMEPCDKNWDMLKEAPSHVMVQPTVSPDEDAAEWLGRYVELAMALKIKFNPLGGACS